MSYRTPRYSALIQTTKLIFLPPNTSRVPRPLALINHRTSLAPTRN